MKQWDRNRLFYKKLKATQAKTSNRRPCSVFEHRRQLCECTSPLPNLNLYVCSILLSDGSNGGRVIPTHESGCMSGATKLQ